MPEDDNQPLPPPPPPPPVPIGNAAALRREQRLNRERQGQRRDRMREAGIPETHRVHSAIVEALSFVVASRQLTDTFTHDMAILVFEVKTAAERVLVERKGCEPDATARAVRRQMRIRRDHRHDRVLRLPPSGRDDERDDI